MGGFEAPEDERGEEGRRSGRKEVEGGRRRKCRDLIHEMKLQSSSIRLDGEGGGVSWYMAPA